MPFNRGPQANQALNLNNFALIFSIRARIFISVLIAGDQSSSNRIFILVWRFSKTILPFPFFDSRALTACPRRSRTIYPAASPLAVFLNS